MHWGVYVAVVLYFFGFYFYKKIFGNRGGKQVLIHLYNYVNGEPIFDKTIKGYIAKRLKFSSDEQMKLPLKPVLWTAIPDSKFCRITKKGQRLYSLCLDGEDNFYWMVLNKTKMRETTEPYEVPILDEKGNKIYEDVYERDDHGEIVYDRVKGKDGKWLKEDGEYVLEPKLVKQQKVEIKEITKIVPALHEQIIESDVKLYYLNKKQELREKYKVEKQKSKWEVIAPFAIIAVLLLGVVYLSYNHLQKISLDTQKSVSIFQQAVEKMSSGENPLSKDDSDAKPADYGKKEKTGGGS